MVLESILSPIKAEKRPWQMFFIGFLYSSIAIFLGLWVFERLAGVLALLLTVVASLPIMYNALRLEEKKDIFIDKEATLLKEHSKALSFFMFLFLGITASYVVWFVFLPQDTVTTIFSSQISTISDIKDGLTANAPSQSSFLIILFNNLRVMTMCILFSFLFGAGSIFILTWNASVIAAAIGIFIRNNLAAVANLTGMDRIASYFGIVITGVLKYSLHGIPEILAYFIAALAGGIISVAVIRHDFGTKKFERILVDTSDLIAISVILLFFATVIEVYVSHALF